ARPVAAKPRGTDRRPRKTGRVAVLGAGALLMAAVAAIAAFSRTPVPAPVEARPAVPPVGLAPVDSPVAPAPEASGKAEVPMKASVPAAKSPAAPAPQSPPAPAVETP